MTTEDCQNAIQAELDDSLVRLAMIGPGGEKMVRFACVINDLRHAAGRTGLGAVMGSKNLKAVAARGTNRIELADKDGVRTLANWLRDNWKDTSWNMHDMGTNAGLEDLNEIGALPTRNFQDGQFEGASKIGGPALRDAITIDRESCFACSIRCKRVVEVHNELDSLQTRRGGPQRAVRRRPHIRRSGI
jgi:aldehyde:ferredoxin oxidoreductase